MTNYGQGMTINALLQKIILWRSEILTFELQTWVLGATSCLNVIHNYANLLQNTSKNDKSYGPDMTINALFSKISFEGFL